MLEDKGEVQQLTLDRIRPSRGGNRAVVTRLEREANSLIHEYTVGPIGTEVTSRLKAIAKTIKEKHRYLKQVDEQIYDRSATQKLEKEIIDSSEWDTKIYELSEKISDFLREKVSGSIAQESLTENAASPAPFGLGIFSPRAQHNASSPSRSNHSESDSGVRLPQINLQKFNGDVTRFNSFWQSFEFAVHNNTDVPKIGKLNS